MVIFIINKNSYMRKIHGMQSHIQFMLCLCSYGEISFHQWIEGRQVNHAIKVHSSKKRQRYQINLSLWLLVERITKYFVFYQALFPNGWAWPLHCLKPFVCSHGKHLPPLRHENNWERAWRGRLLWNYAAHLLSWIIDNIRAQTNNNYIFSSPILWELR